MKLKAKININKSPVHRKSVRPQNLYQCSLQMVTEQLQQKSEKKKGPIMLKYINNLLGLTIKDIFVSYQSEGNTVNIKGIKILHPWDRI